MRGWLGVGVVGLLLLSATPTVGLECWQQVTSTDQIPSFQWSGADKTRSATCSDGEEYCVQYSAHMENGMNYTTGGCLSAVRAQESHDHISCQFDGQRRVLFLYFLGKDAPVMATAYCCKTSMCNRCNHGLLKVTNESVIRQRAGIPSHNVSTRQRYPQFFGQLLVPPQEAEYRHFRRLSRYHDDRTRALFALTPAQHEQQSGTWEQPLPMHEYREASLRSSRQLQQVSSPADVPECEPQYGAVQSYKTNATNFCALLDNRVDCKATKDAGFGLVHGSVTLKQEDFPQLKFPLALRCEWTNSNGCVPFECYINGMPNDLECWQSCPDPCFSVKRCDTFSKECTCQGFPVDLTYVAPTTTSTTTPAPTTTTSTPAPTTAENELPGTTPVDDHLQTCPCEAPAINPVPADKSCRDHVTRSPCKESYYKRKDDPPPPLICNWHQVTGCIPWECYSTPGDMDCWSVCTDPCMPKKYCTVQHECQCYWDEKVLDDPHCAHVKPAQPTITTSTTPAPTTTPLPPCDCQALSEKITDLEEQLEKTSKQTDLPDVFECAPAILQATTAAVVATTEAVCDLPDMHSIAHDGFNCKFHKYGVEGHMGKMGAEIPAGAWPPGDNRVPHIVVSGVKYTKLSAWGTWKVLAGSGLTMHDEQVYETQDHHVKAAGDIEGMEIAGVIIEFLPSPVSFLKPVTLHMPAYDLDGELAKGREFSVAQFDPKQNKWVLKPVSKGVEVIVNGTITGETNSFSLYAAVSFPPQESHCKRNLGMCVSMSVLGSIIGAALATLALGMLCCRKAGDDSVVLEDEMDVLYYYFALWSNAVDEVKNGPSLGTLTMLARGKLGGGAMAGGGLMGGRSVGGAMNGMNATVSTSLGALQTSTSMGKRLEVSLPTAEQLHKASTDLDGLVSRLRERKSSHTSITTSSETFSSFSVTGSEPDAPDHSSGAGGGPAYGGRGSGSQANLLRAPMQWPRASAIDIELGVGQAPRAQKALRDVTLARNADGGVGIGFMQSEIGGVVEVIKVVASGPAASTGSVNVGDVIHMIDGVSTRGLTAAEVSAKLIGAPLSQVVLSISSGDGGGVEGTRSEHTSQGTQESASVADSGASGDARGGPSRKLARSATLRAFQAADRDGNGVLNLDEFMAAVRSHSVRLEQQQQEQEGQRTAESVGASARWASGDAREREAISLSGAPRPSVMTFPDSS